MTKHTKTKMALLYGAMAIAPFAAPTEAFAQNTGTAAGNSDEIVVTARRREESLQDVPIAVSSISGAQLEQIGAADITTLQKTTPNATIQVARGSNSTLIAFIRGVGQQDPLWGFEPGVGLYVDDVYIARPQAAVLDIFDVQRVEVLRGPQGTLYGRNTIGGAVKYVTRRLGDTAQGQVRVNLGSFGQSDLIGSGVVPLSDQLSVGGAVAVYRRDGFGQNLTTGAEHYDKNVDAVRLSAEWTPNADTFFRFAADKVTDNSNARHGHREAPFLNSLGAVIPGTEVLPGRFDTRAGLGDDNSVETEGASFTAEWRAAPWLTLKSITAVRDGETKTNIDFDNTPTPYLDVPAIYSDSQTTQEIQGLFDFGNVQGVAGLYYLRSTAEGAFDTIVGATGATVGTAGKVNTISLAAFADVSIDLNDQWSLSLGGRYTEDQKDAFVFRGTYLGLAGSPWTGRAPAATLLLTRSNYSRERSFDAFSPRVSVSFKPSEDLTTYASYSRGFKSGGFDMRGDVILTPNSVNGYNPEFVDTFEIGAKASLFDGALRLNGAIFASEYKDQQITRQEPTTTGIVASFVDNAGQVDIQGFELEGAAFFNEWLSANFAVGYLKGDYKAYLTRNAAGATLDLSNTAGLQNTPEWTGSFSLVADVPLFANLGSVQIIPSVSYRSAFRLFEFQNAALDPDAVTLVDLSAVWQVADTPLTVSLHGKNLTDESYRTAGYNFPGATFGNSIIGFYGPPRTVTATVAVKF